MNITNVGVYIKRYGHSLALATFLFYIFSSYSFSAPLVEGQKVTADFSEAERALVPELGTEPKFAPEPNSEPEPEPEPDRSQQDYAELFESVFGHKQQLPDSLLVPFVIGNRQYGKITVYPAETSEQSRVSSEHVLKVLAPFVSAPLEGELRSKTLDQQIIKLSLLNGLGLIAEFDANAFSFQIKIPPHLRRFQVLDKESERLPANYEYAIKPNDYTGFVNFRGGQTYSDEDDVENESDRSTQINFDTAFRYKGLVTEGIVEYTDSTEFRRRDFRLVYDRPEKMLRYSLGDIHIPVQGFQTAPPIAGFSISKDFSLQPYALTRPVAKKELFISRPSTVEIYANGALTETQQVEAGPYNFFQSALSQGTNDVKVLIRDDTGAETWVDIEGYYNVRGLKEGSNQYSINGGFLRTEQNPNYHYDIHQPLMSLFYRYGYSYNITLGGYFQALPDHALFGSQTSWSTPKGNINTNIAMSSNPQTEIGSAIQILYFYRDNKLSNNPYNRSWQASTEYTGRNFSRITDPVEHVNIPYAINGSVTQDLSTSLYGSLSASYNWARKNSPRNNRSTLSGSLTKRLIRSARVTFRLTNQNGDVTMEDSWRALLLFNYDFDDSNNVLTGRLDSRDSTLGINLQSNSSDNRFSNMLTTSTSDTTDVSFSDRVQYSGYRGEAALSHTHEKPSEGSALNETQVTLQTSLLFADGDFAWARVVNNSFAMVETNEVLADYNVGINKNGNGRFMGYSDAFGDAAITSLSPYQIRDLKLEIPKLPIGYEINGFNHTLLPSYKSGYLIKVTGKASGMVRGQLLDSENKAIQYQSGRVDSIDDNSIPTVGFFTNKNGVFIIYGLVAGVNELKLNSDQYLPVKLIIPNDCPSNFCKLGRVQLKRKPAEGFFSESESESEIEAAVESKVGVDALTENSEAISTVESELGGRAEGNAGANSEANTNVNSEIDARVVDEKVGEGSEQKPVPEPSVDASFKKKE